MHKTVLPALAGVLSVALAGSAQAQNARTWVSGSGVDQVGCGPIASPCRTLQFAHDQTNAGGEVNFKDPAGYGSVVISKSINIVADGVLAGVLAKAGGNAIEITAGTTSDVILRGLTIEGAGFANNGIVVNSARRVSVRNSTINGFGNSQYPEGTGVLIQLSSGTLMFNMSESYALQNRFAGVWIAPNSGTVNATIDHSVTSQNGRGMEFSGNNGATINASLSNVVASGNFTAGVVLFDSSTVAFSDVVVANNAGDGILLGSAASVALLNRCSITRNSYYGVGSQGGTAFSYGNNLIQYNTPADVQSSLNTQYKLQ